MSDEFEKTPEQGQEGADPSREAKMAEIKARAAALRAARTAAGGGAPTPTAAADAASAAAAPAGASASGDHQPPQDTAAPAAPGAAAGGETGGKMSREDKLAAIRARAEALRAARGAAPPSSAPAAPAKPGTRPAVPAAVEVPVSSLNPGGRPGSPPQAPALEAFGTLNQSVEITGEAVEAENLKKLLGGLGAYQNPLRGDVWQIDYRYYAEAKRRLEGAGYSVTERDYLGRPLTAWNPTARGWTRVES